MITRKTVLVLGAGASVPYGFPTDNELAKQVCSVAGASYTRNWCDGFIEHLKGAAPEEAASWSNLSQRMADLQNALQVARPCSIDKFLEGRPDLADVGRLAISTVLLRAEGDFKPRLWSDVTEGHWYDLLKSRMFGPLEEFARNKIRIITFNYERSLEFYLFTSLRPHYGPDVPDDKYYETMHRIPLLHVYGSLGPLPWQPSDGAIPYGTRDYGETLRASKGILIFREGSGDEAQQNLEKAKEWLQWADRILFLGFGFREDNVERLALAGVLKPRQKISGTCYGLGQTDRNRVEYCTAWAKRPVRMADPRRGKCAIRFPDQKEAKCYDFLHDHADLS
jgi:hypothetical protein